MAPRSNSQRLKTSAAQVTGLQLWASRSTALPSAGSDSWLVLSSLGCQDPQLLRPGSSLELSSEMRACGLSPSLHVPQSLVTVSLLLPLASVPSHFMNSSTKAATASANGHAHISLCPALSPPHTLRPQVGQERSGDSGGSMSEGLLDGENRNRRDVEFKRSTVPGMGHRFQFHQSQALSSPQTAPITNHELSPEIRRNW